MIIVLDSDFDPQTDCPFRGLDDLGAYCNITGSEDCYSKYCTLKKEDVSVCLKEE